MRPNEEGERKDERTVWQFITKTKGEMHVTRRVQQRKLMKGRGTTDKGT